MFKILKKLNIIFCDTSKTAVGQIGILKGSDNYYVIIKLINSQSPKKMELLSWKILACLIYR